MTTLNATQARALVAIVKAVTETVAESEPIGAPGGVLYAVLMVQGCSWNQYESLMGALVRTGKLRLEADCYHIA